MSDENRNYYVAWKVPFSPATDFVLPGQGGGRKYFEKEEEARAFAERLKSEGIKTGSYPGQQIFGHEIQVRWGKVEEDKMKGFSKKGGSEKK